MWHPIGATCRHSAPERLGVVLGVACLILCLSHADGLDFTVRWQGGGSRDMSRDLFHTQRLLTLTRRSLPGEEHRGRIPGFPCVHSSLRLTSMSFHF